MNISGNKNDITSANNEYLVLLRSTKIAAGRKLPMATSGIRGTLDEIPDLEMK